jgi:hypothetical protein
MCAEDGLFPSLLKPSPPARVYRRAALGLMAAGVVRVDVALVAWVTEVAGLTI